MNKKRRKLSLNSETLRDLNGSQLGEAAGGFTTLICTDCTRGCTACTIACTGCTVACTVCAC
jgi:hypothetical protein